MQKQFSTFTNVRECVYKSACEQTVRPIFNCWPVIWAGEKEWTDVRAPWAIDWSFWKGEALWIHCGLSEKRGGVQVDEWVRTVWTVINRAPFP